MNAPNLVSYEQVLVASDEWWEDRLREHDESGGAVVAAMALAAFSGALVGFIVGLIVGLLVG
jgi:hypothetical protein